MKGDLADPLTALLVGAVMLGALGLFFGGLAWLAKRMHPRARPTSAMDRARKSWGGGL